MRRISLVLLGFGNVGQAVASLLEDYDGYRTEGARLELGAVFDRGGGIDPSGVSAAELLRAKRANGTVTSLSTAPRLSVEDALGASEDTVLVDTSITDAETGGPGLAPSKRALDMGRSTVFASKGPLVAAFDDLAERAKANGARIGASAAVGIPLPSLEVGLLGLRGAGLTRFRGVLNDTTNQILRDLEAGLSLDESIERARIEGTIEEDPRLDVDGWDAAYKLLLLARAIWDPALPLSTVDTKGVGEVGKSDIDEARSRRKRIRLLATAERDDSGAFRLKTEAESVGAEDPIYHLGPGEKAVVFETREMGVITIRSSKGGPRATAACALKDVLNVAVAPSPFYAS
jgi:homoserine dehydrogenase